MLTGKTAVITGASRGIGRAIALEMARSGADVAAIYASSDQAAQELCREIEALGRRAFCYRCDVADFEAAGRAIGRIEGDLGGVDILVNNAGVTADRLIGQMKPEEFDRVLDVNLKGAFYMIRHTYRGFARKRAGRIINIASVSGIAGNAGQANYAAAKAGLIGLTKTAARELAGRNITVNAIAPGFIDTDMTRKMSPQALERAAAAIPMRRLGRPQDVAHLAVFLAGDFAQYITGEVIRVDGGLCM
jgi:3-oxoacyl-[acyl-carrier protein] reductase